MNLPAITEDIIQAIEDNSLSPATKAAYESDYNHYRLFIGSHGPEKVKQYLLALAAGGFKWNTIKRRLASIYYYNPELELSRKFMKGLRNTLGQHNTAKTLSKQAPPINKASLISITSHLKGRDKALLLIGWVGALRVSELVNIEAEHLTRTEDGYILTLYKSKNIKTGEKQEKFLPYSSDAHLCPVRAIEALNISEGPLFTSRNGNKLTRSNIADMVKKYFGQEYSSHSLRAGFITEAFAMGATTSEVMRQSGHKSISSLMLYDRNQVTRANAVSKLL